MIYEVELGTKGIRSLKRELERINSKLDTIVAKGERRLGEYGVGELFEAVPHQEIDGNLPPSVSMTRAVDGVSVNMVGPDSAYFEFGTGLTGKGKYPESAIPQRVGWEYDVNDHGTEGWQYTHKLTGKSTHSVGMEPQHPVLTASIETGKMVQKIVGEVLDEEFN